VTDALARCQHLRCHAHTRGRASLIHWLFSLALFMRPPCRPPAAQAASALLALQLWMIVTPLRCSPTLKPLLIQQSGDAGGDRPLGSWGLHWTVGDRPLGPWGLKDLLGPGWAPGAWLGSPGPELSPPWPRFLPFPLRMHARVCAMCLRWPTPRRCGIDACPAERHKEDDAAAWESQPREQRRAKQDSRDGARAGASGSSRGSVELAAHPLGQTHQGTNPAAAAATAVGIGTINPLLQCFWAPLRRPVVPAAAAGVHARPWGGVVGAHAESAEERRRRRQWPEEGAAGGDEAAPLLLPPAQQGVQWWLQQVRSGGGGGPAWGACCGWLAGWALPAWLFLLLLSGVPASATTRNTPPAVPAPVPSPPPPSPPSPPPARP